MQNKVYIITGVASSGKSTIGSQLANRLGLPFYDGDDFHPQANVDKMKSGIPLTDEDRWPWLQAINDFCKNHLKEKGSLVVCSSALKEVYRQKLEHGIKEEQVFWAHLLGDFETIKERMQQREGHFMPESLLKSQFEVQEPITKGLKLDVKMSVEEIINEIIKTEKEMKNTVGLIGLGVMGTSLARNIADKGFSLAIYNREVPGTEEAIAEKAKIKHTELANAAAFNNLADFVASLQVPRQIIIMVNAGKAVDAVIDDLCPLLEKGDIIVDAGNSHFNDTLKREKNLADKGFRFVGTGVSGGEEGALKGPSIMPGGAEDAFNDISDVLIAIAAKNDLGESCCRYVGGGGAGHFVKMVHNGIEYAEMQLIAEMYAYLRHGMAYEPEDIADIFRKWQKGINACYLLEITCDILRKNDQNGDLILDSILDSAGNKGTGSWTTITACELGVPIPTITAALFARYQSSFHGSRARYSSLFRLQQSLTNTSIDNLENVLYFARMANHHQGFDLIRQASEKFAWKIDLTNLSVIWSNGCIIRSSLLKEIRKGFEDGALEVFENPHLHRFTVTHFESCKLALMQMNAGNLALPCHNASFDYFKYLTTRDSNANMIQAQRDYFGAHTYKLKGDPEGESVHTIW